MDPVTLSLMAASIGGGIMQATGKNKQKSIDPNWLKQHFGAQAVNEEMLTLYNRILNSQYGQQLMAGAAEQGQQFENNVNRQSAAAGFGPGGGADSGASIFSSAAAGQAGAGLQRGVQGSIMQSALPAAQSLVRDRMNAVVNSEQSRLESNAASPSPMQTLGGMLSRGANAGMAAGAPAPGAAAMAQAAPSMQAPRGMDPTLMNQAANSPVMVSPRGTTMANVGATDVGVSPGSVYHKRRGAVSRLGSYLGTGMQRLAMNGGS